MQCYGTIGCTCTYVFDLSFTPFHTESGAVKICILIRPLVVDGYHHFICKLVRDQCVMRYKTLSVGNTRH